MKLILYLLVAVLIACCSTTTQKWDTVTASKTCFDAATKGKYDLTDKQLKRVTKICDCIGQKMVAQFKTEKEANDKMTDAADIANECRELWQSNPANH
ncbi:MAG: hypothetical protein KAY50_06055 [Chitinophagaceae bacterium]|nr:hypothetical protein [Chitinophagaceae bacterium]